jgi:ribosomal protein S18 acetylase RimI-like enzyme
MLIAYIDDVAAGFVSGVEMSHPDKGTEMFLYKLSVAEENEGGVGRSLVAALGKLAVERGCYGIWVGVEPDKIAAIATYQAAGAEQPEPFVTLTGTFSPV